MFPTYSMRERVADAVVHIGGIAFAVAGASALALNAIGRLPARDIAGLAIYGTGLIAMFAASAGYNLSRKPVLKERLRRLDHAAIFLMIAGSYTPFALSKIGGGTGFALLAAVWGIALFGIVVKLWAPRRGEHLSVALYLSQGWVIVFALDPLIAAVPELLDHDWPGPRAANAFHDRHARWDGRARSAWETFDRAGGDKP